MDLTFFIIKEKYTNDVASFLFCEKMW